MPVAVTPVTTLRDRRAFIDFPFRLHAGTPWIPPVRVERHIYLNPRLRINAYFKHAEAQLFLARRDGEVVGRISAQIDRNAQAHQGNRWGHFGFLELVDDAEVMAALRDAAMDWLRERGCDRAVGPFDFTMNDEAGVLYEGFELEPMIKQPWHPPYYVQRCEEAGFTKEVDLWMWTLEVTDRSKVLPVIFELAGNVEREHGIVLRKMTRRRLRKDLEVFQEIYNDAWSRNWGFVPYTDEDIKAYSEELQIVFDHHWFMIAEFEGTGEPVGMAITVPDINQVLKRMNGRLLPLGWLTFLRRQRYMNRVRVGFLGVKREHQHTGVAAKLYVEHFDMAAVRPQTGGEMGWILETNTAMNRGMEAMGGRIVKRYRVFGIDL